MLEALFGEDADGFEESGAKGVKLGLTRPPLLRNNTKLSGLSNLGATCYLNSLLQTLYFTSEFKGA